MNLCNVCKKYFNEPHDCTTTREEKLPIVLYVEKGSFTFNCVESAEKLHGWGSPEKYILNKEHESLLREARAKVWEEAFQAIKSESNTHGIGFTETEEGNGYRFAMRKCMERIKEQVAKARKE